MNDISIVIPAYNEEENLDILLDRLLSFQREKGFHFHIMVVNDGSQDRTGAIADRYAEMGQGILVLHNRNAPQGMGYALKWGTQQTRTPVVIWLMGDLSDDLETIHRIQEKIENGYDLVVASRYMAGGSPGDLDPLKSFLSRSYSFSMGMIFRIPVHDINNAFRGFRREVFENVRLESDDFAISPEFIIKAKLAGYRIGEVPTTYTNRRRGKNKFRMIRMIFRYSLLLRYLISERRPPAPPRN